MDLKVQPSASLRSLAIATIRKEITEGRMAPGARLIERDLCDALGVSRTVIREAIRHLEAEGYITSLPRRGPIVAPLDEDGIRSIFEIREALEAKAAALFVERATNEDRGAIRDLIAELMSHEHSEDHTEGLLILDRFRQVMLEGSGNTLFEALLTPLHGRVHMLQVRTALSPERRAEALQCLCVLADALQGDDPEAAAKASRACFESSIRFALKAYARS